MHGVVSSGIALPLALLTWLGRQGTLAVAISLALGTVMPSSLGAALKPHLSGAVFLLLAIAFLRMDTTALKGYLHRPLLVLAVLCWTSLIIPLAIGGLGLALELDQRSTPLFLGILLQAVASPIMSAPALAALMGMESTLILITLVLSTGLVPLTAPLFAHFFAGSALFIPPLALAAQLAAILGGAALVGLLVRRRFSLPLIRRYSLPLDGLNIIILFIFAAAIMENVGRQLLSAPLYFVLTSALAMLVFFSILISTLLVFLPSGRGRALGLAFMTSNRNMGLMLAATGGVVPELTWLYLAVSQLPIYCSPHLLKLVARRFPSLGRS
ncbi:hypothetical protein [Desulfogranum mediterraneum]|uniref:hypothetical protein n=1 Tax=Desulfogranum mediterraneum TaxID=160661 RepID=UPI0003F50C7D|nr:hypothetical protein [Desulfogranum mediterraneum]